GRAVPADVGDEALDRPVLAPVGGELLLPVLLGERAREHHVLGEVVACEGGRLPGQRSALARRVRLLVLPLDPRGVAGVAQYVLEAGDRSAGDRDGGGERGRQGG